MKLFRELFLRLIDPFYTLFRSFLSLQTYRYGVCGALNMSFDISLYFIFYHFLLHEQDFNFAFLTVSAPIAAFLFSFCFSFPSGFFLMRTIVFSESYIRGRVQLFRYLSVVLANIVANYFLLKLLVEHFGIYPTLSKVLTTLIIVGFTFLAQKNFTFKTTKETKEK